MPPISNYLVHHVSPESRRRLAAWNLDLSVVLTPPAIFTALVWPPVGIAVLMFVSFYAVAATAFDALETADVRVTQDGAPPQTPQTGEGEEAAK